jgi:hypothetical protein
MPPDQQQPGPTSSPSSLGAEPTGSARPTGPRWRRLTLHALFAAAVLVAVHVAGAPLGTALTPPITAMLLVGAVVISALPRHAYLIAGLTGLAVLTQWVSMRYFAYHLLLLGGAYLLRRRPWLLAAFVVLGGVVIPKEFFRLFYHFPFLHDWINSFLLAHFMVVVAYWHRAQKRGRAGETGFAGWLALFMFPTSAPNPINFAPSDIWRARSDDARAVVRSLGILSLKAGVVVAMAYLAPRLRLMDQTPAQVMALSFPQLWASTMWSYLHVALTLSGTADVVIVVARLYGWQLPHSFRFALLAWNPVELWRRWAIYNRKLLLTLVYFPLGGGERHRMLNVMATFLASAFVLHSGWVGSKYWEVGAGGWRDQTAYFLLQGAAVCACLWLWQLRGKDPQADRELRWSWGRVACTVATQAMSAWMHIIVLTPEVEWLDRWRLMARCLGLLW